MPIVVQRSCTIGHTKWLLESLLTLVFLTLEIFYASTQLLETLGLATPLTVFIVFYFLSSLATGKFSWLERLFISNEDSLKQVHDRAELEFYSTQIKKTREKTGILIFVSLFERRLVILADEGISAHYPNSVWEELTHSVSIDFKKGNMFSGLKKAITKCGELLANKLPASNDNIDQISNTLIIKQ